MPKLRSCWPLSLLIVSALTLATMPGIAAAQAEGFKTLDVEAGGISIEYPDSWTVMPRTKAALRRQVAALAKKDARLAEVVAESAQLDRQPDALEERVMDLKGALAGRYVGNIRVYVHPDRRFPRTLEEYASTFALAEEALGWTVQDLAAVRVDGKKRAYRVDLVRESADGRLLPASWLTLPYRDGDVSVHVTFFQNDPGDEALLDRIVDGVHLI
jgi:hypothetical protein